MSNRGFLITHDGGEGSGKSTQAKRLTAKLERKGFTVFTPHEPGGTPVGELIRDLLLHKKEIDICGETEVLLFSASRRQLVGDVLLPKLEDGELLNLDRFYDSTTAYQGYGRGISQEDIRRITEFATMGLKPDLTIIYDVDPMIGLERATRDSADRMESLDLEFHTRVNMGFQIIAIQEPQRCEVINTNELTLDEVEEQVTEIVNRRFGFGI